MVHWRAGFEKRLWVSVVLMMACMIVACSHHPRHQNAPVLQARFADGDFIKVTSRHNEVAQALPAMYYDVSIPSFDGVELKATVYQPALAPWQKAPLIVHSHSFGMFRMSSPASLYGEVIVTGRAALEAWRQGYWVLSYDQRGHGDSGGQVRVMDPEYEVRDLSIVLDWAERHLSRLQFQEGNPLVGMVGESYSGALQLLGAAEDSRIDAIVPFNTWYDIRASLAPGRVPKTGWLNWLERLNVFVNGFQRPAFDDSLYETYAQASKGRVSDVVAERWDNRSIKSHCESMPEWRADTLLVQGFRDVLFPINEAVKTYQCLNETGVDVRMLGVQGGHLLPLAQSAWVPGFHVEQVFYCNGVKYGIQDVVLSWFDAKLKGQEDRIASLPEICLTHGHGSGSVLPEVPIGGQAFVVKDTWVKEAPGAALVKPLTWFGRFLDWLPGNRLGVAGQELEQQGGRFGPAFMPLMQAERERKLAGIPLANLNLSADVNQVDLGPTLFVGIGIRRAHKKSVRLLNDQVLPIKGYGDHFIEMPGVSAILQPGEALGLLVYVRSPQYVGLGLKQQAPVKVAGVLEIPFSDEGYQGISAFKADWQAAY